MVEIIYIYPSILHTDDRIPVVNIYLKDTFGSGAGGVGAEIANNGSLWYPRIIYPRDMWSKMACLVDSVFLVVA